MVDVIQELELFSSEKLLLLDLKMSQLNLASEQIALPCYQIFLNEIRQWKTRLVRTFEYENPCFRPKLGKIVEI